MMENSNKIIYIDPVSEVPAYVQIYERFRHVITEGLLRPGDRVPSLRNLAAELNLARGTIEAAYEMLNGEGYFLAKGQAGTVVAPFLGSHPLSLPSSSKPRELDLKSDIGVNTLPNPFQLGLPALDAFPRKIWSRIGCRVLKSSTSREMNYPNPCGYMPLRKALAGYLHVSRGIACKPSQIVITDGYRGSLDLISRAFLKSNDQIWMEDPGYPAAQKLLKAAGGDIFSVPVDEEGMLIGYGIMHAPEARFAVITPSHQSPMGVTLSLSRRLELLQWAADNKSWIIEDDYDGEYRYTSRPLPAVKSLDHEDRVIYAGTLSKVISPALRLAYLVIPESQIDHVEDICQIFQNGCPWATQATVTDFIVEGHFSRHLKKMRSLYSLRRSYLVNALNKTFGSQVKVELQAGGMHLLLRLNKEYNDQYLSRHLNENGLAVHSLSDWNTKHDCGQGLMMGFTNIHSQQYAEMLCEKLKNTINLSES